MRYYLITPYGYFRSNYQLDKLEDLCIKKIGIQTGPFGSLLHNSDYVLIGTPILTVEHLGENRIIHNGIPKVSNDDTDRLSRFLLKKGDIVFSRVGSVDRRALVRVAEDGWLYSGRCLRVRPDPELLDSSYLSYLMGLPSFKEYVRKIAVGATMPSLNTKILSSIPICYPPLPTQRKIAAILSAYDDLIENNTRRIKILEEMAQNLYREWFVNFRFPGHEHARFVDSPLGRIPEGWEVMELRNIVVLCRNGVQPKEYPEEIFEYFSFPAYDSGKLPAIEKGSEIKSSKYLVPQDCVLVPKLNPHISRVWLPKPKNNLRSIASTEYLILEPKRGSSAYYYVFFSRPEMIEKLAGRADGTSTSHKRLKPVDFLDQLVVMPPDSITDSFDLQIIPMMDIIDTLINTNTTLRTTRDLLLPKLISGGVDVSEIDITIPVEVKT